VELYSRCRKNRGGEQVSEPTKEYLFAKAELCTKLARQQEERDEIAEAIRNIERANRAMARIFNLDEKEGKSE
jgi:hypothetical protein